MTLPPLLPPLLGMNETVCLFVPPQTDGPGIAAQFIYDGRNFIQADFFFFPSHANSPKSQSGRTETGPGDTFARHARLAAVEKQGGRLASGGSCCRGGEKSGESGLRSTNIETSRSYSGGSALRQPTPSELRRCRSSSLKCLGLQCVTSLLFTCSFS